MVILINLKANKVKFTSHCIASTVNCIFWVLMKDKYYDKKTSLKNWVITRAAFEEPCLLLQVLFIYPRWLLHWRMMRCFISLLHLFSIDAWFGSLCFLVKHATHKKRKHVTHKITYWCKSKTTGLKSNDFQKVNKYNCNGLPTLKNQRCRKDYCITISMQKNQLIS